MALTIKTETDFGEVRELYVRVNNLDQLKNHAEGGSDLVRFRGYISKEAFEARRAFVWELVLQCDIDVSRPVWPQAYEALKAYDPTLEVAPIAAAPELPDGVPEERRAAVEAEARAERVRFQGELAASETLRGALSSAKDC